ncbi:MAG: 50S ribosomal protein L25 [bacterium]
MKEILLEAKKRTLKGKQGTRQLRRQNIIPVVLYGAGNDSVALEVDKKTIFDIVHEGSWESMIIDLKVDGESKAKNVMIKELQLDPIKRSIVHLDLYEISLKEKIKIHVSVEVVGESPGVKSGGGILEHIMREVEIECLPTNIPASIEVDVSGLEIGGSVTAAEVKVPQGVTLITEPGRTLVHVIAPTVYEEPVAAEEGVVAAEPGSAEPEVISKGKKEEEEAEGEPKKGQGKE